MKNKNLLIGGGVLVAGLLFFYLRSKRTTDNGEEKSIGAGRGSGTGSGTGSGSGTSGGSIIPTTTPPTTTPSTGSGTGTGASTSVASNTQIINNALERAKASLKGKNSFNGLSEGGSRGLDFDGGIY